MKQVNFIECSLFNPTQKIHLINHIGVAKCFFVLLFHLNNWTPKIGGNNVGGVDFDLFVRWCFVGLFVRNLVKLKCWKLDWNWFNISLFKWFGFICENLVTALPLYVNPFEIFAGAKFSFVFFLVNSTFCKNQPQTKAMQNISNQNPMRKFKWLKRLTFTIHDNNNKKIVYIIYLFWSHFLSANFHTVIILTFPFHLQSDFDCL